MEISLTGVDCAILLIALGFLSISAILSISEAALKWYDAKMGGKKTKGGILSGAEILRQMEKGNISITNFDKKRLNPNSVNVRLHPILLEYIIDDERPYVDMKRDNPVREIDLRDYPDGFIMEPGKFYLGSTVEYTETKHGIVPMLEGRSSNARLSLAIHVTAGFGDVGFSGKWTLEMFSIIPVKIYHGIDIGQVYYLTLSGEELMNYKESGKYNGQDMPVASKSYKDFE